jgi:hypothetical protein
MFAADRDFRIQTGYKSSQSDLDTTAVGYEANKSN